jgi:glycosyltransferase involved in cell wall biosynthesis
MYSLDDIQIFIPTHNRPDFLRQSLQCLIEQTAGVADITVFNNDGTGETSKVIEEFSVYGVKEYKSKGTLIDCMKEAENMVTSKYVMFFHDDDLLNPKYLEYALEALNTYPNIAYITTKTTNFNGKKRSIIKPANKNHYYFTQQKDFANYIYLMEGVAMQTAIYNTDLFKKNPRDNESYGKFFDWPYLVKLAGCGNVVLFEDPEMFYVRIHPEQWSWNSSGWGISIDNVINWDYCFYKAIQANKKYSLGFFIFYSKCMLLLRGKYTAYVSKKIKNKYPFDVVKKLASAKFSMKPEYDFESNEKLRNILISYISNKYLWEDFGNHVELDQEDEEDIIFLLLLGFMNSEPSANVIEIETAKETKYTFFQKIFSITNCETHKVLCLLGLKMKFKKMK